MLPSTTFKLNRPSIRHGRKIVAILTSITIILLLALYFTPRHPHPPTLQPIPWLPVRLPSDTRIAKATISYAPSSNNRSLALHAAHNAAFGYDIHVLRTPIVRGFANPLLWFQHIIVEEIVKKRVKERAEWIMFFDTSSLLISNPHIPLNIFVPPHALSYHHAFKSLTIIATKSNSVDMDSSVFFVRVSTLSIRLLTLAMSAVYDAPEREWGKYIVGAAMQEVLEREEWREKVVWMPREWWDEESAVFKRVEGVLEMEDALGELEGKKEEGEVPALYPGKEEVESFWNGVEEAKQVLTEARDRGYAKEDGEFAQECRDVKDAVELWTWDMEGMGRNLQTLKDVEGCDEGRRDH